MSKHSSQCGDIFISSFKFNVINWNRFLLKSVGHLELQCPHNPCPPICFPSPSTRTEHQDCPLSESFSVHPVYFLPLYINGSTHRAPGVPPSVVLHATKFSVNV